MGDLVTPDNAHGREEYVAELQGILAEGICPFCAPHAERFLNQQIAAEGSWFAVRNKYPYADSEHHILIVHRTHIDSLDGLTTYEMGELLVLVRRICKAFGIDGGAVAMRFGNTRKTGATVVHLHAHLIVPNMKDAEHSETVWFPIG